jgi:hypothetical protein
MTSSLRYLTVASRVFASLRAISDARPTPYSFRLVTVSQDSAAARIVDGSAVRAVPANPKASSGGRGDLAYERFWDVFTSAFFQNIQDRAGRPRPSEIESHLGPSREGGLAFVVSCRGPKAYMAWRSGHCPTTAISPRGASSCGAELQPIGCLTFCLLLCGRSPNLRPHAL